MKNSRFTGGVLDCIAVSLVTSFIISLSFGLATPWAITYSINWFCKHCEISGKRFKFTGTGAGLIGNWIIWMILTSVTFGIYGFWVTPKLYNWIVSHVEIEE